MLLIVTPGTVSNARSLKGKTVPRRLLSLGRCAYPRGGPLTGLFWRTVFEKSLPRYVVTLLPFPIAAILRPEWALMLSQAPLPMFGLVLIIETYVLSVSGPDARKRLIDPAEAERGLDLLKIRARDALTKIAVGRAMTLGTLHLVIEQSGLLRVPPLTYASVQTDEAPGGFVELTDTEQDLLAKTLFDEDLDEHRLRRINVMQNTQVRNFDLDVCEISAHARLAALSSPRSA